MRVLGQSATYNAVVVLLILGIMCQACIVLVNNSDHEAARTALAELREVEWVLKASVDAQVAERARSRERHEALLRAIKRRVP